MADPWAIVDDGFSAASVPDGWAVVDPGHPTAGPSGSILQDWKNKFITAGVNAAAGLESLPRTLAQGVDWAGSKIGVNPGAESALASIPTPFSGQPASQEPLFYSYPQARDALFRTTGATEYVPQTEAGRVTLGALSAAVPAIANPSTIPAMLGGGAASQFVSDVTQGMPNWARVPATFAAFALGSKLGTGLSNAATNISTAPFRQPSELYQAYRRQGVPTDLAGDVTQNPTLQFAQAFAGKMPGGEGYIGAQADKAVQAWQDAVERNAKLLGPSATPQEAGTTLQRAASGWLQNFKNESGRLWGNFRLLVPGDTEIPVSNFAQTLDDVRASFGRAQTLGQAFEPGTVGKIRAALAADVSPNGTLPWQAVQATRTQLGELLSDPRVIADTTGAQLKRLYGALTQDMQSGAAGISPNARAAFDGANAYTAAGHDLLESHLEPILTATNPEQAANYALQQVRSGGSRLAALNTALPGSAADLGAVRLRQAALNGPGRFPAAMSETRISPEASQAMFGPRQQDVQDLLAIANAQKETASLANHSNTAVHSMRGPARLIGAKELGELGHEFAGTPGRIAGMGVGLFSPEIFGYGTRMVATNPVIARLLASPPIAPFSPAPVLPLPGRMLPALPGAYTATRALQGQLQ